MPTQSRHVALPCILALAGFAALTTESSAAGRQHAASAKARSHHQHVARVSLGVAPHGFVHRWSRHLANRDHVATTEYTGHAARGSTGDGGHSFSGMASYYSGGQRVASGGAFRSSGYTCAHRSLPFGTHLRVADPRTGRSVVVTVNDRGPFVRGRVLDLSLGAARALGMTGRGVMRISASVI